jgi:integrase
MRITLTDAWLRAELRKPRTKATDFADAKTPSLTLRVSPGGGASWSTRRMLPDGRYGRVGLGGYPAVGISEARKRALTQQSALSAGRDPVAERRAVRAKAIADKNRLTVSDAWRNYADAKTTSGQWCEQHARNAELFFARVVAPAVGSRALMDVTRGDWTRLIAGAGKGTGARATALRFIRGFDAYSEIAGWIGHAVLPRKSAMLAPPCSPRQHTPGDNDIVAIWNAAGTLRATARVYVRLLILTAARRGEVAGIRAGEVDLDAGLWRLPAERSKNKTPHVMPLHALAVAELKSIWPTAPLPDRYCVLGESGGHNGLQDYSRVKSQLDAVIGNGAWVVHDLRRSARTGMARLGVLTDHAEAALNHVSHRSALQRVYNTHSYSDEAVAALRVWQNHVERLLHPDTAEIVPLRRGVG